LSRIDSGALRSQMRDLSHSDVVRGDVKYGVAFRRAARTDQHGFDNIAYVNVRLALSSVSKNSHLVRIPQQLPQEIKSDTMRLSRSNDVAKPKASAHQFEHVAIRANQRLTRELAGSVSGNGNERSVILVCFRCAEVTVHAAA